MTWCNWAKPLQGSIASQIGGQVQIEAIQGQQYPEISFSIGKPNAS
jgi:hypothetical protein